MTTNIDSAPTNSLAPFKSPLIALFDTEESVAQALSEKRFSWERATLGKCVNVPNVKPGHQRLLHLNCNWPDNLHEFDIAVFDLTREEHEDFSNLSSPLDKNRHQKGFALLCEYPQRIFDPRPFASNAISREVHALLKKGAVIVAFCGSETKAHYQSAEINSYGNVDVTNKYDASLFDFYADFPEFESKSGKKINVAAGHQFLNSLLSKYVDNAKYECIFKHPTIFQGGKYDPIENFHPLLLNGNDEIVGFVHVVSGGMVMVLPNFHDKASFVSELCGSYLPEIVPELFPFHGEFRWLHQDDYLLPGESKLKQRKTELQEQYERQMAQIEAEIGENRKEHQFLHDLLHQSGDELVKAVERYMKWLGFADVKNMDEANPEVREEDLQIETDKGLLVIEVKGVGGTSTDKDCSQISKIRLRRMEERQKFDVFGLYVVNHQRYMPPKSRSNPPFTENQRADAVLDKRGLITTYTLFKTYFYIESGILSKEQVREKLFGYGLVNLEPMNIVSLGTPQEILKQGRVAILTLNGEVTLKKGCTLVAKKNNQMEKVIVQSMMLHDVEVEELSEGEVGLMLSERIRKGTELLVVVE